MSIAQGPESGDQPEYDAPQPVAHESDPETWGRVTTAQPESKRRRFSGVHLAVASVSSLVVGVLATSLTFALIDSSDRGDSAGGVRAQGSPAASAEVDAEVDEAPAAVDEEDDVVDDVIGVGDGFSVTTWDGTEIETFVHDFSVDQACKYGQPSWEPEKAPDSRIVQLTVDVSNLGEESYFMDELVTLSAEGYTQPVDSGFMYCEEPNDGANSWHGTGLVEQGEKKLLYGAFEVQPDAAQLVLVSTGNGKVLIDIPESPVASIGDGGSPEPTTSAG